MKENTSQVEVKEIWAKPELETVSVKESTLNSFLVISDGAFFS